MCEKRLSFFLALLCYVATVEKSCYQIIQDKNVHSKMIEDVESGAYGNHQMAIVYFIKA